MKFFKVILVTDLNLVTDSLMIKEQKQKDEMEIVYFVMHVVDFKKRITKTVLDRKNSHEQMKYPDKR